MISDKELIALDLRGFIPGPSENESDFLDRVASCLQKLPMPEHPLIVEDWEEVGQVMSAYYNCRVDWVLASYANKGLPFWQGAATWISDTGVYIHLRRAFQKGDYLKIYKRKEVLSHELVHVTRMAFEEPEFEEVLAYQTSGSFWRKFFGPLFARSWESTLFFGLLVLSLGIQALALYCLDPTLLSLGACLPLIGLIVLCARLLVVHRRFKRCFKNLTPISRTHPLALMLRLTDQEIRYFSRWSQEEIYAYAARQEGLRWRLICLVYLGSVPKRLGYLASFDARQITQSFRACSKSF